MKIRPVYSISILAIVLGLCAIGMDCVSTETDGAGGYVQVCHT